MNRFLSHGDWSLIPGPAALTTLVSSLDLQESTLYRPEEIARSFLSFPGMNLRHGASPTCWEWRAGLQDIDEYLEVKMTLFEGEAPSWGGSELIADCSFERIESLWLHLRSRHPAVWLHGPDCVVHTPVSFRNEMSS